MNGLAPGSGSSQQDDRPYRLASTDGYGWLLAGTIGNAAYACHEFGGDSFATVAELEAVHGPMRPIRYPAEAEEEALRNAWEQAGVFAPAAVVNAWTVVAGECPGDLEEQLRHMVAGRPGSWEASTLKDLVRYGIGTRTDTRLKDPSAAAAQASLENVFRAWALGDEAVAEIAETTAQLVGSLVDADERGFARYELGVWRWREASIVNLLASHAQNHVWS
ncbi:hypothetical protein AB0I28_32580 [Phytomonospora sp. NPDC050363]|uniref:hypothetical protein n=1 Tax=Phytomonospora sp. NPDC050363 TaxID=3155642 RepID=UPI0033C4D972